MNKVVYVSDGNVSITPPLIIAWIIPVLVLSAIDHLVRVEGEARELSRPTEIFHRTSPVEPAQVRNNRLFTSENIRFRNSIDGLYIKKTVIAGKR
jgi:hypothetical protein